MKFTISDLFYQHTKKKEYIKVIEILNSLSEEQKKAVELYGESKYAMGDSDGYETGYNESLY